VTSRCGGRATDGGVVFTLDRDGKFSGHFAELFKRDGDSKQVGAASCGVELRERTVEACP
jgi:hypothetical protein